jgi:uroporphyrinogen-III decarboxylase
LRQGIQCDAVWDLVAIHGESEALGSKLLMGDDMPPSVIEPIVQDYSKDLPRIRVPDPCKDGRLPNLLAIISRLKELCEGRIPVLGYCHAPFSHVDFGVAREEVGDDLGC